MYVHFHRCPYTVHCNTYCVVMKGSLVWLCCAKRTKSYPVPAGYVCCRSIVSCILIAHHIFYMLCLWLLLQCCVRLFLWTAVATVLCTHVTMGSSCYGVVYACYYGQQLLCSSDFHTLFLNMTAPYMYLTTAVVLVTSTCIWLVQKLLFAHEKPVTDQKRWSLAICS